jgi:hypothetical protein
MAKRTTTIKAKDATQFDILEHLLETKLTSVEFNKTAQNELEAKKLGPRQKKFLKKRGYEVSKNKKDAPKK